MSEVAEQFVLGVFAKYPRPGQVKTRLARHYGPAAAADLYRAFLGDWLDRLACLPYRRVLAYTPPPAQQYFAELAAGRFELQVQATGDLGRRMSTFIQDRFDGGAAAVALVGSDTPDLPLEYVVRAFGELRGADVVIGPCPDGGYYLIGCSRPAGALFRDIAWGGPSVLEQTRGQLLRLGLTDRLLPAWEDVDTAEALGRLAERLGRRPDRARAAWPRTYAAVARLTSGLAGESAG